MADDTETQNDYTKDALPPGNSAVEVAARCGFGPLSPLVSEAWHGDSKPCVSCGKLVRREAGSCAECGEDLSDTMMQKMRTHAGPWYVLEHVRPFPGVTCERIVRQIRRGVLTGSTIVRGPTTDHQWRFAGETPGLSKYLGLCWSCQTSVVEDQSRCPACNVELGVLSDAPVDPARFDTSVTPPAASTTIPSTRKPKSRFFSTLIRRSSTPPNGRFIRIGRRKP